MSENLRVYKNDTPQYDLYKQMHEKHTLDYVMKKRLQYSKLNNPPKLQMKPRIIMINY